MPRKKASGKYDINATPTVYPSERPYRSHRIPACQRCRRRKARCSVDVPGQPCLLCRTHKATCHIVSAQTDPNHRPTPTAHTSTTVVAPAVAATPQQQQQPSPPTEEPSIHPGAGTPSNDAGCRNSEQSPMIIGPVTAEDLRVIQTYVSQSGSGSGPSRTTPFHVLCNDQSGPVIYQNVPVWRKGWKMGKLRGALQLEIMEQILGPLAPVLISMYFKKIHPWFPVLEKRNFSHPSTHRGTTNQPPALLCGIYAASLILWNESEQTKHHPRPDITYAWNLAVAAIQQDFLAPKLDTIYAALIDLNGRPIVSMKGNVLTSGRTTVLAHTLGLNRDPSGWRIPEEEKRTRIKLWWAVLLHDRWSSFSHGVPPAIVKEQYDVPLPNQQFLGPLSTTADEQGADCFLAMCGLTEILGDVLPLLYHLQNRGTQDFSKKLRRAQANLDDWEAALPAWLQTHDGEDAQIEPGACSLHLSVLAVKMLLCRVALMGVSRNPNAEETLHFHQFQLRSSAQAIVDFICQLQAVHFQAFWWPYSAYHIASASIILLRSAIENQTPTTNLKHLMDKLTHAKDAHDWDVGEMCLSQCHDAVSAMEAAVSSSSTTTEEEEEEGGGSSSPLPEVQPVHSNNNAQWPYPYLSQEARDFSAAAAGLELSTALPWGVGFPEDLPWTNLWDVFEPTANMPSV